MIDQSDTGKSLDVKLRIAQRKAEKVEELRAKALEEAKVLNELKVLQNANAVTFMPPPRDEKRITSEAEKDDGITIKNAKAKTNFDSDNGTALTNTDSISPPQKPTIEFDNQNHAIISSRADQLGKILLRLCVKYPDARAVVESFLADTSDEDIIFDPPIAPQLTRKTSNSKVHQGPQSLPPIKKTTKDLLLPASEQKGKLEEEPRPSTVLKSAKEDPQLPPSRFPVTKSARKDLEQPQPPPKQISAQTTVGGEKRKWKESVGASIVTQSPKKSKPSVGDNSKDKQTHSLPGKFVIPKWSKIDSSFKWLEYTPPTPKMSSKPPRTPEGTKIKSTLESSKPKAINPLLSLFDSDDSEGESSSGKYPCTINSCRKVFGAPRNLDRHMKALHKSEGETFGCSLCTKQFTRQDCVHRHLETSHTSAGLKCNACGFTYRNADTLNAHMRLEHGVKVVEEKSNGISTTENTVKKTLRFQDDSRKP